MKPPVIAAVLLLAGCATAPARVVVQKVEVPVQVACAAAPPPAEPFVDTPEAIAKAADLFERLKLILAGRAQRDARIFELNAAVAGCR